MGWDLSAFDAELDALWAGPAVDAPLLARSYASGSSELSDIDAQLDQLDSDRALERLIPVARPPSRPPRSRVGYSSAPPPSTDPKSAEIALPERAEQAAAGGHDASGELPLPGTTPGAPRSGSFWLEPHAATVPGRDDTLEPFDDELLETDDVIQFAAASAEGPKKPSSPNGEGTLFDAKAELHADAQQEADAAFAELFVEARRQSSMPSARRSQAPERYNDDTETFDASARAFVEGAAARGGEDHLSAEELDSAEFELMLDTDVTSGDPQTTTPEDGEPRAPQNSEKRPSFLGRLFGRKEE